MVTVTQNVGDKASVLDYLWVSAMILKRDAKCHLFRTRCGTMTLSSGRIGEGRSAVRGARRVHEGRRTRLGTSLKNRARAQGSADPCRFQIGHRQSRRGDAGPFEALPHLRGIGESGSRGSHTSHLRLQPAPGLSSFDQQVQAPCLHRRPHSSRPIGPVRGPSDTPPILGPRSRRLPASHGGSKTHL